MESRAAELEASLSRTAELVERWRPLVDCHTAEFITHDLWNKVVPAELREELDTADPDHVLAVFCTQAPQYYRDSEVSAEYSKILPFDADGCIQQSDNSMKCRVSENSTLLPKFEKFLCEAREACNAFSKLTISPKELSDLLGPPPEDSIEADEGQLPLMCTKKQHEVRAMAMVVSRLTDTLGAKAGIVDLGAGKGYLGAAVARHGRPVLGLEISAGNAQAAEHRVARLCGAKGSRKTTEQHNRSASMPPASDWLRTATVPVSDDTDIAMLAAAHFLAAPARLTLAGLHACGDLTPAGLRIFLRTPAARAVCLVGCCYHLLTEHGAGISESEGAIGFPLSLRLRGCVLGRNARMLAQQSLERSLDDVDQLLASARGLHWRALLETILPAAEGGAAHRVGRLAARCTSFPDYGRRALRKLAVLDPASVEELAALETLHVSSGRRMRWLSLLRLALAPVVERLLLLDRTQLLIERGITRWYLIRLFAPRISPRCFALVALKEQETDICED